MNSNEDLIEKEDLIASNNINHNYDYYNNGNANDNENDDDEDDVNEDEEDVYYNYNNQANHNNLLQVNNQKLPMTIESYNSRTDNNLQLNTYNTKQMMAEPLPEKDMQSIILLSLLKEDRQNDSDPSLKYAINGEWFIDYCNSINLVVNFFINGEFNQQ